MATSREPVISPTESPVDPTTILQCTVNQLLTEVRRETRDKEDTSPSLSENLLSALYCVFRQTLLHALDLIDKNSITRFFCSSGRELYLVQASSGNKVYTCLPTSNYCSCPSFVYSVLLREDVLMCKHVLAVQLARVMDRCKEEEVGGKELADLLANDHNGLYEQCSTSSTATVT